MVEGKSERLDRILRNLHSDVGESLRTCVVTNERGLIVAALDTHSTTNESVAAMVSLVSDTSHRVAQNLQLEKTSLVQVNTPSDKFVVLEFDVHGRPFRLGVIVGGDMPRRSIRQLLRRRNVDHILLRAAKEIRKVMEE
ncbi:MAG: hypothetical protein ACTSYX_05665 [Candidatus Thorarchaeota archaeon]